MSFMKSSKQLNATVGNKNKSFCERWRRRRAAILQPYEFQTSLITSYNFWCKLQNNPVLIYFAHFVLSSSVFNL